MGLSRNLSSDVRSLVLGLVLLFSAFNIAQARDIPLFSASGAWAPQYDEILHDVMTRRSHLVRPGDWIVLKDGKRFPFNGYLGGGSTTAVIDIGNNQVLRLPQKKKMSHYLWRFTEEMRDLDRSELPHVKVIEGGEYYSVVQKENLRWNLEDFYFRKMYLQRENAEALKRLFEFYAKTWEFENVADAHGTNIGYNGEKWLVFDAGGESISDQTDRWIPNDRSRGNSFSRTAPDELRERAIQIVENRRRQAMAKGRCMGMIRAIFGALGR